MSKAEIITFIIALPAITNPIGNMAIFAGLTGDKTLEEKRHSALIAGIAILIILILVTWSGDLILNAFGIDIASFEIAGGLIIALMGLSMLHAKTSSIHHNADEAEDTRTKQSVDVAPMAISIVIKPPKRVRIFNITDFTDAQNGFRTF